MCTRFPRALTAAMLLAMTSTLAIAQAPPPPNPQESSQPSDQAPTSDQMPTKKQCDDMKKMDPSTMSKSEHDSMMKKCKDMQKKAKSGY